MRPEEFAELRRLARHDANVRASNKRDRLAMCDGKHRFDTYAQAQSTLRKRCGEMRAYHCSRCNGYHVGDSANQEKRSKASLRHIKEKIERKIKRKEALD